MATQLLLAAGATGLALLALVGWLLWRSWSRSADARLAAAVGEMNARMDAIVRELSAALEHAEDESRRHRTLAELATSLDVDDVLARTLYAVTASVPADAAVVSLAGAADGKPLVATLGLSREEAERQGVVAGPPDGRRARSITIAYRYDVERDSAEDLIRAGVAVPLVVDDEEIGALAAFTRARARTFSDDEVHELEQLAARATPAIRNALSFRDARQLADLDALTGLHNRRFFHETLAREVGRAQRYGRKLALLVLDTDDFKAVNDRIGHLAGDAVLAEIAERIRTVVRTADIPCRVGGDEFAVLLPESTHAEADKLYRRLHRAVSSRPVGGETVFLSAGVAELTPEDDARSFFERADEALYGAKAAGKAKLVAADAGSS